MKNTRPRRLLPALSCALLLLTGLAVGCNAGREGRLGRATRQDGGASLQRSADVPERGYDVEHYAIDLELFPEERRIEGACTVRLVADAPQLDEIVLDLVGLDVRGVEDGAGAPLDFVHEGGLLRVRPAVPLAQGSGTELLVRYGGTPVTGLWFSGRRADGSGPNQVFTQGEATHSRGWFPCFDHPSDRATSEIEVTMPAGWISVAPGAMVGSEQSGGKRTDRWRMDTTHPAYLTSLVAGEFVVEQADWEGTPLLFVGEAHYEPWFDATFEQTDEILSFFSDFTGVRYPYPKYSQALVENFPWGGMENISATTLTPLTLDEERGHRDTPSHALIAHEAAHQWFGDLVTCNDWRDLWLNEGFATYMTELYFEHTLGEDVFRARMRDAQDAYTAQDVGNQRRSIVSDRYKEPEDLFDTRIYQGAAARLHLLRYIVGDGPFREGVRAYVSEFREANAVTADFQAVMERVTGQDLDTFFDQWFRSKGYPEFELDWSYDARKGRVVLDVDQTQDSWDGTPAAFRVPVEIEIYDARGTTTHRVVVDEREQSFSFPVEERPFYVQFDKNGWIPKRVNYLRRDAAEWLAVITSDSDVNARRDAARALGEIAAGARTNESHAHDVYVAELADRLARDGSPWVRAAAAEALGVAGGVEARERLVQASGADPEARVRVAALKALWNFTPGPALATLGTRRFEEAFSWETMGAAAGLVVRADPEGALEWLRARLGTPSPHDRLASLLLAQFGAIDDPRVANVLAGAAKDNGLHPTARGVALEQLAKVQRGRARHAQVIAPFLESESFRLRQSAIEALGTLGDDRAKQALRAYYPSSKNQRERRAIEANLAAGAAR